MFDPLSNFKLNKILSAVNALPTTLASSFTEVKNAIAGVQNTANTIDTDVETVNTNLNNLANKSVYEQNYILPKADLLNFKNFYTQYTDAPTTPVEVLNVTGSGIISNLLCVFHYGGVQECQIIIDGVTLRGYTDTSSSGGGVNNTFGIVDKSIVNFDTYNGTYLCTKDGISVPCSLLHLSQMLEGPEAHSMINLSKSIVQSGVDIEIGNSTGIPSHRVYICDGYLKFDNSLVIKAKSNDNRYSEVNIYASYALL